MEFRSRTPGPVRLSAVFDMHLSESLDTILVK